LKQFTQVFGCDGKADAGIEPQQIRLCLASMMAGEGVAVELSNGESRNFVQLRRATNPGARWLKNSLVQAMFPARQSRRDSSP